MIVFSFPEKVLRLGFTYTVWNELKKATIFTFVTLFLETFHSHDLIWSREKSCYLKLYEYVSWFLTIF